MFLESENNSWKLQIISGKFQNNAINNVKQISLSHVIRSTILVFKALFQVFGGFNFDIETISNTSLEPNFRVALIELEHKMQSHMSCIFFFAYLKYIQNVSVFLLFMSIFRAG